MATRKPPQQPAAKPGKGQDGAAGPVQTEGARHPGRPATQTAALGAAKSGGSVPPDYADGIPRSATAPPPGPRPAVTAPLPEHTRPRTHAERNA